MKKVLVIFPLLIPGGLLAQRYNSSSDDSSEILVFLVVGIAINLFIIWGIINHATRAERLLKAQLAQTILLQRLLESKGIDSDFKPIEIAMLSKKLKAIELTINKDEEDAINASKNSQQ